MSTTAPSGTASAGGAPAGMPARLWEMAKHGARGTIPPWVRAAPDAAATAPSRIGQIARRAAQTAAAAGVVAGGIGIGIGATEQTSRPADLTHPGDGAPGADHASTGPGGGAPGAYHTSTDPGTGSPASSDSGGAPGPPGSASEGEVTLHTSSDGGHLAAGLATTWRIPSHDAVGGEHGEADVQGEHDGLTVQMYQDVVVYEGADGMFSVDAVEYVVVRDEHGHAYVFRENYHTVVPDPPGQETDLVVHETDRVQVVEHPDGSFSVTQADNSISVTAGSDGDGQHEVTVTQTESVQIGHDPHADGHDTVSLTENEYGATTSDQTEVVTEQTGGPPTRAEEPSGQTDDGLVHDTAAPTPPTAATAASSQVEIAQSTPSETLSAARVMSTPSPLATSLGVATAAGGLTSSHEPQPPSAFAGLRRGPAEPGHGGAPAGHFPNEPVPAQHPAGGAFDSTFSSVGCGSFEHPAAGLLAGAGGPGADPGAGFAGHDQPGLGEPGVHDGIDPAAVGPAGPGGGAGAGSAGEHQEASEADPGCLAGSAQAPSGHDPGMDAAVLH
jgi:hypothetical protein